MKIEKAKKEFTPVTLTFETEAELDIFTEVFYRVGGQGMKRVFGRAGYVHELLSDAGGISTNHGETQGSITVQ